MLLLSILCLSNIYTFAYNCTMIYISLFYHCFDFRYGSFVRFVDLIATIVSFVSRQVSEFCIIYFQNTCVSMKDDRLVQTANYVVTADFTVISGFRYLFFDVFCVPGVGTFDARPMSVLQKFRVTDTNPHPCPHPPPPGLYSDKCIMLLHC